MQKLITQYSLLIRNNDAFNVAGKSKKLSHFNL